MYKRQGQGRVAFHIQAGFFELGPRLVQQALGLRELCLKRSRINLEQRIPLVHQRPFFVILPCLLYTSRCV